MLVPLNGWVRYLSIWSKVNWFDSWTNVWTGFCLTNLIFYALSLSWGLKALLLAYWTSLKILSSKSFLACCNYSIASHLIMIRFCFMSLIILKYFSARSLHLSFHISADSISIWDRVLSLVITYLPVDLSRFGCSDTIGRRGSFLVYLLDLLDRLDGSVWVNALIF